MIIRSGSCLCGQIRYKVKDAPIRIGLCHCVDCRKESGSSFVTFGIWPRHAFEWTGEVRYFQGRGFCPDCGGRVFNEPQAGGPDDAAVEIRIGSLDMAPTDLQPDYEIWAKRRENWLSPLDVPQFGEDRS